MASSTCAGVAVMGVTGAGAATAAGVTKVAGEAERGVGMGITDSGDARRQRVGYDCVMLINPLRMRPWTPVLTVVGA